MSGPGGHVYYPRALVTMRVPTMGSAYTRRNASAQRVALDFTVVPRKVTVSKNDFNTADECNITLGMDQAGCDPRLLSNAIVKVYMADAGHAGAWLPTEADLQFVGVGVSAKRSMGEGKMGVEIKALDYTTLFLAQKPIGPNGVPPYSDTLSQAWARICDNVGLQDYDTGRVVSSVTALRDNALFLGEAAQVAADTPIGKGVLDRVANKGHVQTDPNHSAWDVWRTCCDSLGLITFIEADHVVVTDASTYYTSDDPVVLTWGLNVSEMEEYRDMQRVSSKGIHVTSFDPVNFSGTEAFYPERDNPNVLRKVKRVASTKKRGGAQGDGLLDVAAYEHLLYPAPATEDQLQEIAERVWEERSRQELQGSVTTTEMVLPARPVNDRTLRKSVFALNHGHPVVVSFDADALDPVHRSQSIPERAAFLMARGYETQLAQLMAEDAGFLQRLNPVFAIKSLEYEMDGEGERFECRIGYCSRIAPDGSTENG